MGRASGNKRRERAQLNFPEGGKKNPPKERGGGSGDGGGKGRFSEVLIEG